MNFITNKYSMKNMFRGWMLMLLSLFIVSCTDEYEPIYEGQDSDWATILISMKTNKNTIAVL
jgi:hypothetical protein